MKIKRQELLDNLEMVKAGLSAKEMLEQSSAFVFKNGEVMTFNDEIACRKQIGLNGIQGAVQAQSLLDILGKLEDEVLEVAENDKGQLEFTAKRKCFAVTKDAEIFLPIDRVEVPKNWHSLPKEFIEAIGLVQHCVSTEESKFFLTCIHITAKFIEACDSLQAMRVELDNDQFKKSALIRGASLVQLTSLGMNQVSQTENWVHFKNEAGLIYSCRRYAEDYPSLDKALEVNGHPIVIPKGLMEASDRAAVFAADRAGDPLISVAMTTGRMWIKGVGNAGWYKEVKKVSYDGPDLRFFIAPDLLKHISEHYQNAIIVNDKLAVLGGSWKYVTVLGIEDQDDENKTKE